MKTWKVFNILGGLAIALAMLVPAARADDQNQATRLSFDHPIQLPGKVLPAGTYWFQLADGIAGSPVVRVFDSEHRELQASFLTISAERLRTTDQSAFTFTRADGTQPEALLVWFYPGRTDGHEFLYPKKVSKELAMQQRETVIATRPAKFSMSQAVAAGN